MRKLLTYTLTAGLSLAALGIFSGPESAQFPNRNFSGGYSLGYGPFGPRYGTGYSVMTGPGGYRLTSGSAYSGGIYGGPYYRNLDTASTWFGSQAVSSNYVTGYGNFGPRLGSSYSAAVGPLGSRVQTSQAYSPGIFGGTYASGAGYASGVGFVGTTPVPMMKWYEYNITPFGSAAVSGTWPW